MIGPMVNTTQANIRFMMEDFIHCKFYTVNRGACALVSFNISKKIDLM